MSVQYDIHSLLAKRAEGADGWVPMDPGEVAETVKAKRPLVNKSLFNLTQAGRIELQRAPNGRSITGFKVLAAPEPPKRRRNIRKRSAGRQRLAKPMVVRPERRVPTPALNRYAEAKAKFERLTTELGDLVTAEFKVNPVAEEGLLLLARLREIEASGQPAKDGA